ncbi:MAG: DUF3604 domain-containing protein [Deltaproteobacteria bacterium]|nr:MAG: DUF3604 domain-containing protein [Deltaproteobacteria bacterium]
MRLSWKALGVCFGSLLIASVLVGSHCGIESRSESPSIVDDQEELEAAPREEEHGRCAEFTKNRRPFFGELHLHTAYSLDANLEGTRLTPRQAYAFAQGEPVTPPGAKAAIRIDRPLDFAAVTDHAELASSPHVRTPNPRRTSKKAARSTESVPTSGCWLSMRTSRTKSASITPPARAATEASTVGRTGNRCGSTFKTRPNVTTTEVKNAASRRLSHTNGQRPPRTARCTWGRFTISIAMSSFGTRSCRGYRSTSSMRVTSKSFGQACECIASTSTTGATS